MNTSNAINTLEIKPLMVCVHNDEVLDYFSSNHSMSLEVNELIQYDMTQYIIKHYVWESVYNSLVITTDEDNIKYLPKPKSKRGRRSQKKTT